MTYGLCYMMSTCLCDAISVVFALVIRRALATGPTAVDVRLGFTLEAVEATVGFAVKATIGLGVAITRCTVIVQLTVVESTALRTGPAAVYVSFVAILDSIEATGGNENQIDASLPVVARPRMAVFVCFAFFVVSTRFA